MADTHPRYLPREFVSEIRFWAPPELSGSALYSLIRIVESAYARGYSDGHLTGFDEGYDHQKRPDENDVNRLREAITGETEEPDRG